eukprot:5423431-Pyramimonas_sp.AAC.1
MARRIWHNIYPGGKRQELMYLCLDLVQRTCRHLVPAAAAASYQLDCVCSLLRDRHQQPPLGTSASSTMGPPTKASSKGYDNWSKGGGGKGCGSYGGSQMASVACLDSGMARLIICG